MARKNLILDRYEPLGTAGVGGFGTVQMAWDPRIQRKVAIKTILLTEHDAYRAKLPGARATASSGLPDAVPAGNGGESPLDGGGHARVAGSPTADRWHGVLPWEEFLAGEDETAAAEDGGPDAGEGAESEPFDPVTSLAHLPGLDEARTAAMLDDPRIVTVYDFEVRDRMAYLIMEYVEGITLTRLLAEYHDDVTFGMVTAVFDAVAGALMTAHKAGVLHLDIKPDNIMITPQGQVKVTDFGLATLADASGAGTTGGGTIGYMPPEQMRREHLDARTDEWSLASLTYEMLTGDNPFRVASLDEAEAAIRDAELVLPSLCWDDVDEQIDDVVFYALDPDQDERYASVSDFAEEMGKFLGDAEQGREHLSLVVSESLGLLQDDAGDPMDEAYEGWEDPSTARMHVSSGWGDALETVFAPLVTPRQPTEADECGDGDDDFADDLASSRGGGRLHRRDRAPRIPLRDRLGGRVASVAARLFGMAASAAIAFLAAVNMPFLDALGSAWPVAAAIAAVACALAALVRPHLGALAAYCLLGASVAACGHPVVAALLVIATVAWWYAIGHRGVAQANAALAEPVLGAVGAAPALPLLAGAALEPVAAIATVAFGSFAALVMTSFGSGTLLGWDAFAHWDFTQSDVAGNLLLMLKKPVTWITMGGWVAGAGAFSFLRTRSGRALSVVGLVLAAVLAAGIPLAFMAMTPTVAVAVALATVFVATLVV